MTRTSCDAANCPNDAWYRVEAQWTIADFDGMTVCLDHLNSAREYFWRQKVEGLDPVIWNWTLEVEEDQ